MNGRRQTLVLTTLAGLTLGCDGGEEARGPVLSGPYLGQTPPGMTPELFAPGIVSTGHDDLMVVFAADGRELCFAVGGAPHSVTACMREEEGGWTSPEVASFSGHYSAELTMAPDGRHILFSSGRPETGVGPGTGNWQIWTVERIETGWSDPVNLGPEVNSPTVSADYPTLSAAGNLYFFSGNREGGVGRGDIWTARLEDGGYVPPVTPGPEINTEAWEMDPFIAPDEGYLLFASDRPGGSGGLDLFVSFREADGSWGPPQNLGEAVNSEANEVHPMVTPDGRFLFFTSNRTALVGFSQTPLSWEEKLGILESPGNRSEDIYWVDARVIEALRTR